MKFSESGQLVRRILRSFIGWRGNIQVFALDRRLALPAASNRDEVLAAMRGMFERRAELVGTSKPPDSPARP